MNQPDLIPLQNKIAYHFKDEQLLQTAMTHRSSLNERGIKESNERLEFLGDAVLELIITSHLFHAKPNEPEGVLTAARSAIVKTASLSQIALDLDLGSYLKMSKGEAASGGQKNPSILEDAVESLIGALYEDGGLEEAARFIKTYIIPFADEVLSRAQLKDAKSLLQEKVQSTGIASPTYKVISESGPDHDKTFEVAVFINNQEKARGTGKSKQEAEQSAATKALDLI